MPRGRPPGSPGAARQGSPDRLRPVSTGPRPAPPRPDQRGLDRASLHLLSHARHEPPHPVHELGPPREGVTARRAAHELAARTERTCAADLIAVSEPRAAEAAPEGRASCRLGPGLEGDRGDHCSDTPSQRKTKPTSAPMPRAKGKMNPATAMAVRHPRDAAVKSSGDYGVAARFRDAGGTTTV